MINNQWGPRHREPFHPLHNDNKSFCWKWCRFDCECCLACPQLPQHITLLSLGDLAEEMKQETKEIQDKADEYLLCCLAPEDPVHVGQAGTYWQRLTGRRGGDGNYWRDFNLCLSLRVLWPLNERPFKKASFPLFSAAYVLVRAPVKNKYYSQVNTKLLWKQSQKVFTPDCLMHL